MTETYSDVDEIRAALADEFRSAVDEARGRIAAVVDPACPTPAFMEALATELTRAIADPNAVPYPELADPDRYWAAAIQPQMQAAHDQVVSVLEWLEQQVVETMGVAEADLKREVDLVLGAGSTNALADRRELEATLQRRCSDLHHQMAELLDALPDPQLLIDAQTRFHQALHEQAVADVDQLKARYLAEAGGDESHQRFAEQQWSETYGERVAHREAMLAGTSPWRHQHLAVVGYERIRTDVEALVEASVARLQAPLGGLPQLLLTRFDDEVGANA
ncbi:MAG: hypothetical protein AAF081_00800 [Actinomycetota bacterium]